MYRPPTLQEVEALAAELTPDERTSLATRLIIGGVPAPAKPRLNSALLPTRSFGLDHSLFEQEDGGGRR